MYSVCEPLESLIRIFFAPIFFGKPADHVLYLWNNIADVKFKPVDPEKVWYGYSQILLATQLIMVYVFEMASLMWSSSVIFKYLFLSQQWKEKREGNRRRNTHAQHPFFLLYTYCDVQACCSNFTFYWYCLATGAAFNLLCADRDKMIMGKIERHLNNVVHEVFCWTLYLFFFSSHSMISQKSPLLAFFSAAF